MVGMTARRRTLAVLTALLAGLVVPVSGSPAPSRALDAHQVQPWRSTDWHEPVSPLTVTVPFSPPPSRYGAGHRGVDLAAAPGAPVYAAGAGEVMYSGVLVDRGVVSIRHSALLRSTYEPVTAVVQVGDRVSAGDLIGTVDVGHPVCAPATCLHMGLRLQDGSYLDPMMLFRPWRVRLKPW